MSKDKAFQRIVPGVFIQIIGADGECLRQGFVKTGPVEHLNTPFGHERLDGKTLPNEGAGPLCIVEQSPKLEDKPLAWNDLWSVMRLNWQVDPLNTKWTWVDKDAMWSDMMGAVPPARSGNGSFLIGEPNDHDGFGVPIYGCFMLDADTKKCYGRYMTKAQWDRIFVQKRTMNHDTLSLKAME